MKLKEKCRHDLISYNSSRDRSSYHEIAGRFVLVLCGDSVGKHVLPICSFRSRLPYQTSDRAKCSYWMAVWTIRLFDDQIFTNSE